MTQNFNHIVQGVLTVLQGFNIATIPEKYSKYVVIVISALQWYVANIAAASNPVTGDKIAK